MTETDAYHEAHLPIAVNLLERIGPAVLAGGFEALDAAVSSMDDEELTESLVAMAQRTRVDSLVAGRLAYEHRTRTADGEWGRRVRELSALCEVSDRTIFRWMSAYQERAGLELTPAQANARAAADAPSAGGEDWGAMATQQPDEDGLWAEPGEEDEWEGPDFWAADPLDNAQYMRDLVGEPEDPGTGTPSTKYVNPPERGPAARAVIPPDETWLQFTMSQMSAEHEAYAEPELVRLATARWSRLSQKEPLDLLEDLEDIYDGDPPEALAEALRAAEANKAIKPEVVDDGQKAKRKAPSRGSGGKISRVPEQYAGHSNTEKGMEYTRDLHSHLVQLLEEGGPDLVAHVYGTSLGNLSSWAFTLDGCLKKVRKALEDVRLRGQAT